MDAYDARVTTKGELTPEQQLDVLTLIWGENGEDGWVFLPYIPGGGDNVEHRRKSWRETGAFKWPEGKAEVLAHLNKHRDDDLYFTPNIFVGELRKDEWTGEERALYADLDEVDPRSLDGSIRPSIAWESSPGRYQAVWLLNRTWVGASERGGLNHRMTLYTGADASGWDTTQLLRVPGRPNFKPQYRGEDGKPAPGRLLWSGRSQHDPESLDELLPEIADQHIVDDVEEAEIDQVDRRAVWSRVRLHVARNVREYMAMKSWQVEGHDRSDVLWQIERELADAGCTVAEIVAVVKDTAWNKYADRANGIQQLKHEAIKAKSEAINREDEDVLEAEVSSLPTELESYMEVVKRRVPTPTWLVKEIWAKGTVGFIAGAPKSYKSYFAVDLAISVATGLPFLNDSQFPTKRGRVLYIQEEDSEPTVRQRVELLLEGKCSDRHWHAPITLEGVDASSRVESVSDALRHVYWGPASTSSLEGLFPVMRQGFMVSSDEDQAWLDEVCEKMQFDLVIIDTLGTTVGDIDTDKSGPMNARVLKPLKAISEKHGCAIAIVHHNRKPNDSGKARSGQQMLGSVAIHAWVESALYVQAKEMVREGVAEVKIERENKMAEDYKFRVRIPHMQLGDVTHDERLPWDPEVLVGWGDSDKVEGAEEVREEFQKRGYVKGSKLVDDIIADPAIDEDSFTLEDVVKGLGKRRSEVVKQLNNARSEQLLMEKAGVYSVT